MDKTNFNELGMTWQFGNETHFQHTYHLNVVVLSKQAII